MLCASSGPTCWDALDKQIEMVSIYCKQALGKGCLMKLFYFLQTSSMRFVYLIDYIDR